MEWLKQLPLRRRINLTILLICGVALSLACIALLSYELFDFRKAMVRDGAVMADVIGTNVRAALAFDDEDGARNVLQALQSEPHVLAAALYKQDGKKFAEYVRPGGTSYVSDRLDGKGIYFEEGHLAVFRDVVQNGKRIGTIYVESDSQGLNERLLLFSGVALLVLVVTILIVLALSSWLQRPISEPILELAGTARAIAERKDYSVRSPQHAQGEIGVLTTAFNQMLDGIEQRESALREQIAERGRAQEALAVSEKHHRLIFEYSPVPKWIYDIESQRFLSVNKAAQSQYGYSEEEFRQLSMDDICVPETGSGLAAGGSRSGFKITDGEESRHRRKDGSIIHVLVHAHDIEIGSRRGRMAVVQDITERKLAEAKIQAQLARLGQLNQITRAIGERQDVESIFQAVIRSLEDEMPVDFTCVCLYDGVAETLTVTRVGVRSGALSERLTIAEQATLPIDKNGLSRCVMGHLVYEPDVAEIQMPFAQKLASGGLHSVVLAPLLVESKVFGVLVTGRREANSFSSGDCEFIRQLSEHVALAAHQAQLNGALQHAYDDLRQTQQVVMQQERLRALGQMASGIAHDINNAISPISLYVESLLEQEPNLSAQSRDWLQIVAHAIDDVTHTVARLREFYRQREPQLDFAAVQLNTLIDQVAELTRARWLDMPQQRGVMVDFRRDMGSDLPKALAVESEVREALINLVFNAVDAMPDGGTLTLRTKKIERPRNEGAAPETLVAVEVVDTGIGMDEETQRRCLEPFFTTKGERGTGLGLAMVFGIARRHGADLEIESKPGQGTTMRLVFSVAEATPQEASLSTAPSKATIRRSRILVVDDDPLLLKSLRETLELDGHIVVTANGGQPGINTFVAAINTTESFAAVITDLGMPYVDGRRVANAVKGASPSTPVILLTGWGQRMKADGDTPPNVDRVLSKPPKLRELRDALATLIEG